MATAGLMVSLPQMVELALGSPEIGAVNFNLLGAALQVIIHQLKLDEFTVDFRGPDVERMQGLLATAKPGMSLKISEPENMDSTTIMKEEVLGTAEPRKYSKVEPKAGGLSKTQRVIVVEPSRDRRASTLPHVVVGVSQDLFVQINNDVEELKSRMNEMLELANNETIMEAIRAKGEDKITPVIDMWQALSIAKRLESAETGMEKLAGMFENLVQEIGGTGEGGNVVGEIASRIDAIEEKLAEIEAGGVGGGGGGSRRQSVDVDRDVAVDPGDLVDIANDLENLKTRVKTMEDDFAKIMKGSKGKNFGDLFRDIDDIKNKLSAEAEEGESGEAGGSKAGINEETMNALLQKFTDITSKVDILDATYAEQLSKLQQQLLHIEKELGVLNENNNTKAEAPTDVQSVGDLHNKIVALQEEIDNISKAVDKINEEQEERTLNMDALTEQVELLKTTKADREDLEDALAEKADTQQVNRKVSAVQFDAACEGLTRNMEETLRKLTEQEEMWQATLVDLQMTIGCKLDKQEFDPLRDFVNKKIKSLQQRLKALLAMKQEQEAAGTKSKILKNINCISCDKDVIMYKENKFVTLPQPASMPGNRSIKPYITYELDAVRKQQKSLPQGRNMNHLESALQEEKKKEKPADKALPPGHLCNRYCGGSHTMTQPQQRVAHLGHFLNQWGPHAIPLDEGSIMGTDGNMYKARSGDTTPKPVEDLRRPSAQIQTDEPKERVARMSSQLEAISIRRTSKVKSASKTSELEPVKEEKEDEIPERPKSRRSSSAKLQKKGSADKPTASASARSSNTPRGSRKSQGSLKRLSQSDKKELSPPPEEAANEEEVPAEPEPEVEAAEAAEEPPPE